MAKPKKAYKDLTPAYRKRLESAYKSGKFGQGYSSAGRAYAAGASRQVARGQAKTSEAVRSKRRAQARKAKAWSDKHSKSAASRYDPPVNGTPDEKAKYTETYLKAVKELEKGWERKKVKDRKKWDEQALGDLFQQYQVKDADKYLTFETYEPPEDIEPEI
jgi:hypothetical protein